MRKVFVTILLMSAFLGLKAQENDYTMKLDSVMGSDNFDWSRWKKVFSYSLNESGLPVQEEIRYDWENQAWMPSEKTVTERFDDEALVQVNSYRWENGDWKYDHEKLSQYSASDLQQLLSVTVMNVDDTVFGRESYTTYAYDDLNHLTLVMNYRGTDTAWVESSKTEYHYNSDGLLDTCLYSTIRNGNWRESERIAYSYEDQLCVGIFAQRKGGGWGPFGNSWMDSYRYEFEYENGELVTELYYTASGGGWFGGGELTLDSKVEYNFDANGNLLSKTASINNDGKEWIVRDVYENTYDLSVNASSVQGLESFWGYFLKNGMGYALGTTMPLKNLWKSCSVISSTLDTEFTLYCSGFAEVNEQSEEETFKAYSFDGRLVVENMEPADVMVYDMLGRVVASKNQTLKCEINLTPGLYIVNNGKTRMKVIVK